MIRNGWLAALAAAIWAAALLPSSAAGHVACRGDLTPLSSKNTSQVEDAMLCLNNVWRAQHGLAPYLKDARVVQAARSWSKYQSREQVLGHEFDGSTPEKRVVATGYPLLGSSVPEIVASSYCRSAWGLFLRWRSSPGHNAVMLENSPAPTTVGYGVAKWRPQGTGRLKVRAIKGTGDFTYSPANTSETGLTLQHGAIPKGNPTGCDPFVFDPRLERCATKVGRAAKRCKKLARR